MAKQNDIIEDIYAYYKTTVDFTKDDILGVDTNVIKLDENFPYYLNGIRIIETREKGFVYYHSYLSLNMVNIYVDSSFFLSPFYNELIESGNINKIIVISNSIDYEFGLMIKNPMKLVFCCDMSNVNTFGTIVNNLFYRYEFESLNSFIDSKVYMYFNTYAVNYHVNLENTKISIDEHISYFNKCFLNSRICDVGNIKLSNYIYEDNYVYLKDGHIRVYLILDGQVDYRKKLLFLKKFMRNLNKNYKLKGFSVNLVICCILTREVYREKLREVENYNDVFDYPDFTFLKPYKTRFDNLNINIYS